MLGILWTVIIGLVAGLLARALHPGDDKLSFLWTVLLGIAGSFLAKYAGILFGWYEEGESAGFLFSVVGAIVLLALYTWVKNRRAARGGR